MRATVRTLTVGSLSVMVAACDWGRSSRTAEDLRPCPAGLGVVSDAESGDETQRMQGRNGRWSTFLDTGSDGSQIGPPPARDGGTFETSDGGAAGSAHRARMGHPRATPGRTGHRVVIPHGPGGRRASRDPA
jgi:hypothetical protein